VSPELRFVAAFCRWPADEYQRAQLGALQPLVDDWARVAALAEAHRVEGLVWRAIESAGVALPEPVAAEFKTMSEAVRAASLQALSETLRICGALDAAGIEYRILKGLPVALLAYGSPVIKNSVDIDILVRPAETVRTAALLGDLGYSCAYPPRPLDERTFQLLSPVAKEAGFVSPRGQVDLHWALVNQPALLAGLDPWAESRIVELLPGHGVATLEDGANLAYLAAHGAASGWSRLKWLADFSAFLTARPGAEGEMLCHAARSLNGGRVVNQALILVERLLGPGLVPPPSRSGGRAAERLAATALSIIQSRAPGVILENDWGPRLAISSCQRRLRGGMDYRLREAVRAVRRQEAPMRLRWPLPKRLQWLYLVAGPLSLLAQAKSFIGRATFRGSARG
jgi:hypothetical protein